MFYRRRAKARDTKMHMTRLKATFVSLAIVVECLGQSPALRPEVLHFSSRPVEKPGVGGLVSVIDAQHIWIGLDYSSDGGATWSGRFPPQDTEEFDLMFPPQFQQAVFVTSNRGWLTGLRRTWQTEDGGITWSVAFDGGSARSLGHSGRHGWMATWGLNPPTNYITEDLGETWHPCGKPWTSSAGPLDAAFFVNNRVGWIPVSSFDDQDKRNGPASLAKTADGGCNWDLIWSDPLAGEDLYGVHFVDENFGWMGAGPQRLLETSDGGLHWRAVQLPRQDFRLEGLSLVNRQTGWVVGSPPPDLYYTDDGGRRWHVVPDSDLREDREAAREIPPSWGIGLLMKLEAAGAKHDP